MSRMQKEEKQITELTKDATQSDIKAHKRFIVRSSKESLQDLINANCAERSASQKDTTTITRNF